MPPRLTLRMTTTLLLLLLLLLLVVVVVVVVVLLVVVGVEFTVPGKGRRILSAVVRLRWVVVVPILTLISSL